MGIHMTTTTALYRQFLVVLLFTGEAGPRTGMSVSQTHKQYVGLLDSS